MLILSGLHQRSLTALSVFIILLSLGIEFFSPPGVYAGCGYVIAVIIMLYSDDKVKPVLIASAASLAILFSIFFIHLTENFTIVTINCLGSLAGVLIAMFFVMYVKNLREKHEQDNKQVSSLFLHATEGIILANRKGEIVIVNPCAEKLFGYTKEELVGKKIEILLPQDIREKHVGHREQFHQHPVNRSMGAGRDLYAKRKDGSVFPVEISLSHYTLGRESYAIAFIIDITIRKNNEQVLRQQKQELEAVTEEIRELNIDLERKVEARTMMLRETLAQLERSKDELSLSLEKEKELSDLKTRFVSTVSHEFRTPLSTILSSAALIGKYQDADQRDKRERHVERIKESVRLMNDMLEDLLSLGRLDEGLIEAKDETFNFSDFIAAFVNEMQELAKSGQRINLYNAGLGAITSDKNLLKKLLLNLVSNAIKFSPEDSAIDINCEQTGDQLKVSVKDSGIGISHDDQEHLFERFFRARNASNIQGTGLGLHIVSKYLELLRGKITLLSELGNGSIFTILIPIK